MSKSNYSIFYISDLHLDTDFNYLNCGEKYGGSKFERKVLKEIAQELVDSCKTDNEKFLFILGDIAEELPLCQDFLEELSPLFNGWIVYAFGNHEFYNDYVEKDDFLDRIGKLNNIYVFSSAGYLFVREGYLPTFSYNILDTNSDFAVLCGIGGTLNAGYYGLGDDPKFYAPWYKGMPTSLIEERLSKKFLDMHDKFKDVNAPTIVATHYPPELWNNEPVQLKEKTIYINGHTHCSVSDNPHGCYKNMVGYLRSEYVAKELVL